MRDWWPVQQRSVIQSAASVHSGGQNIQSPLLTTSTSLCAQQARLEDPTSTRLVSQSVYAPGGCPDIHLRWPANVSNETRSRKFASYYQDMQNTPSAQQCLWFSLLSSNLHLAAPLVRPWREQTALSPCAQKTLPPQPRQVTWSNFCSGSPFTRAGCLYILHTTCLQLITALATEQVVG